MTTTGFVGAGKDVAALRAAGVPSLYAGSWTAFRRYLKPGDTAVVTQASRISRTPERATAIIRELAGAGITVAVLALTKTLRDGRTAVVTVAHHPPHGVSTTVRIGGEEAASHLGPHHLPPLAARQAHPDHPAAIGILLLTASEATQIEAVYREVLATVPPNLDFERERLVTALDVAEQEPGIRAAERMDSGDYAHPFGTEAETREDERRTREAAEALAAFDAEHPEVAARAAAGREAAVQRALEGRD